LRGYIIVLFGTTLWATTGILIKYLFTHFTITALPMALWRVTIVAVGLLILLALVAPRLLRIKTRDGPQFALYGFLGVAMHQVVWISSVQLNGAAVATVLVYTAPAFVAIFAVRLLGEHLTRKRVLALILSLLGVVLVARAYEIGAANVSGVGILVGVGTGLTYSAYTILSKRAVLNYNSWTAMLWAFIFGAVFLVPLQFLGALPFLSALYPPANFLPMQSEPLGWGVLAFLALVPTLGGFAAYTAGLTHLPAGVASIVATIEPVITAIIAYFLFGEVLNPIQLVGAALILGSVLMLRPRH
jgi:drug/metabolite transporter (DMT)-like permease